MKKLPYTKRALSCVLLPVPHALLFLLFLWIADALERSVGMNGAYTFFAITAIVLLVVFPFASVVSDAVGIYHAVRGIRRGEPGWACLLLIAAALAGTALTVLLSLCFWAGAMSV